MTWGTDRYRTHQYPSESLTALRCRHSAACQSASCQRAGVRPRPGGAAPDHVMIHLAVSEGVPEWATRDGRGVTRRGLIARIDALGTVRSESAETRKLSKWRWRVAIVLHRPRCADKGPGSWLGAQPVHTLPHRLPPLVVRRSPESSVSLTPMAFTVRGGRDRWPRPSHQMAIRSFAVAYLWAWVGVAVQLASRSRAFCDGEPGSAV